MLRLRNLPLVVMTVHPGGTHATQQAGLYGVVVAGSPPSADNFPQ
ncbi:MAG: hypothetical protein PUD83_05160 [Bacteroidales bacterium]|nr:hypothetical protein [Bacteroidales bacterium]MEE1081005.1 hypothetical protein [Bacteroidales bacterium]